MLTNVPTQLRVAARQMVMRHPNSMDCAVYRKVVMRTAGAGAGDVGGLPTMGGMAVLDNEDEPQVDYVPLGEGKLLFGGIYERTKLMDRRDAADQQASSEALVEPLILGAFEVKDSDLVMAMPGGGVVIPYEVVEVLNTVNIPPFLPKYMLAPQGDLLFDPDIAELQDDRT